MIYQWNTKNKSALQLYQMLKDIGIKNNKLHLTLLDEGLADINPLDDNLPEDLADRVVDEIDANPWYYYREISRIPIESGELVNFRFDIASFATIKYKFLGLNLYVEKPRQTGKTVESAVTAGLSFNILSENSTMSLFNFTDKKVRANLNEIKMYLDVLPKYLHIYRFDIIEKNGAEIVKELPESGRGVSTAINRINNNNIVAATAGNTEEGADKAGRGSKTKEQIWDEVGSCPFIDVSLDAAMPAFNTAASNARTKNKLAYMQLMSTPPDLKTRQGKYLYNKIKIGALKFEPFMLDMSLQEIKRAMEAKQTTWLYITFQYFELGFSEKWAQECFVGMTKEKFRRDYLLQWNVEFDGTPFDKGDLERLQDMARFKKYKAIRLLQDYSFKVYEYLDMTPDNTLLYFARRPIIIGCDTSTGLGGDTDCSTAVGTCPETGKTVFTFKSNTLTTKEFGQILMYFVKTFFRKALLVIERNTTGVIETIMGTPYEKRLYYTPMSKEQLSKNYKAHIGGKFLYGIYQISKIRNILYDDMLIYYVKNAKHILDVEDIVLEICTMVRDARGRIDHDKECHDDVLMGKMLSLFPMVHDPHLTSRYNIKKCAIINDIVGELQSLTDDDPIEELAKEDPNKVQTLDDLLYEMEAYGVGPDELAEAKMEHSGGSMKTMMDGWYDDNDDDPFR